MSDSGVLVSSLGASRALAARRACWSRAGGVVSLSVGTVSSCGEVGGLSAGELALAGRLAGASGMCLEEWWGACGSLDVWSARVCGYSLFGFGGFRGAGHWTLARVSDDEGALLARLASDLGPHLGDLLVGYGVTGFHLPLVGLRLRALAAGGYSGFGVSGGSLAHLCDPAGLSRVFDLSALLPRYSSRGDGFLRLCGALGVPFPANRLEGRMPHEVWRGAGGMESAGRALVEDSVAAWRVLRVHDECVGVWPAAVSVSLGVKAAGGGWVDRAGVREY